MPATLIGFWNDEVTRLTALLASTRAQMTTASSDEAAAAADLALVGKQLQEARERVETTRKKLAAIPMPADGDPLLQEMRQALIDVRLAGAGQLEKDVALRQQRAVRAQLTADTAALTAELAAAQAEAKAEKKASDQRLVWLAAAKASPLKDLPAAANAALTADAATATTKIEGDFPKSADADKDFLTRVRARRALAADVAAKTQAVADDAIATATTWEESSTREVSKTAALRRDFEAKVAKLKAFNEAPDRVKQAAAQLKALATRATSPLSTAQNKDLNTSDNALKTAREDTLALLKDRDDAQQDWLDAREDYGKTLLLTLLANPGKTEAELVVSDVTLKGKKKAVDDAVIAVDDAENVAGFATNLPKLEAWFAAVPDALWEQLETLDAAIADLTAIKNTTPATLASDVETAEDALATHLQSVLNEQLYVDTLNDALQLDKTAVSVENDLDRSRQQIASRFVARI